MHEKYVIGRYSGGTSHFLSVPVTSLPRQLYQLTSSIGRYISKELCSKSQYHHKSENNDHLKTTDYQRQSELEFYIFKMKSLMILIFAVAACTMVTGSVFQVRLRVLQDVTSERGSTNFNYLRYLIVGTHPRYPLKRSLVRFQPLQVRACDHIRSATMYLYYAYAHKASFMSETQVPRFLYVGLSPIKC
ncbi:Hypothetical predicted protein [Paramuricea clavata]|uniref:Uncharacterized protein n=1 Tax=Paramuricea clavata TaxID=317549 RepID=A0A6S7GLS2_PARCT|nr:Hypothetical predicted protein [Paramuricea clavata]